LVFGARGSNFGRGLRMEVPSGDQGQSPRRWSGGEAGEAQETLQIVHAGKVFCALLDVVPKRRDVYIICDALWGGGGHC